MTSPTNPYMDPKAPQATAQPAEWAPAAAAPRNPLGTTSLALGAALIGMQLVQVVSQRISIMTGDYAAVGLIGAAVSLVTALIAIAAIVTGAIAIQRPGLPKVAAGIGIGIGVAELSAQLLWFISSLLPY